MTRTTSFHSFRLPFPIAAVAAFAFFVSTATAFADIVTLKSFRPPVDVQRSQQPDKWAPAKAGLQLNAGDVIRTGKRAQAELRMTDGSKMMLWAESRLTVKESGQSRVFGLDFGRVKSMIRKLKRDNKFEVRTPLAAASVRGTVFEIGCDMNGEKGFLDVAEGSVALMKDGAEVLVPEGQRLDFLSDKPLGEPTPRQSQGASETDRAAVRREVGLGMSKEE
ncbi:MAG: FecR domain-containing protein, partial [Elusimicrobia bacterium]|nr:FecR domain-containing protein [Elusimicrobiota bacterium]